VHVDLRRACGISADECVSRRLTHVPGISALKVKAEKAHPEEYRRSSKKYAYDGY
jgi:hypothetical protein